MLRLRLPSARVAAVRTIALLSSCNPVLANNAENRKFQSAVWVSTDEKYWFESDGAKPRDGEKPTTTTAPSRLELYNLDQLVFADAAKRAQYEPSKDARAHTSAKTGKRYSGGFAEKLEAFASEHKYDSKFWISPAQVRKDGLRVVAGSRPCLQILSKTSEFYNADQFNDPSLITCRAINAGSGRVYDKDISRVFREHAESIGQAGQLCYLTLRQLKEANIEVPVGTSEAHVSMRETEFGRLYPVEAIENAAQFLDSLQRFPVTEPTYVISGKLLEGEMKAAAVSMKNKSNYWVSKAEVEARKYKLKPDAAAKSIAPKVKEESGWKAINLASLAPDTQKTILEKYFGRL